MAEEGKKKETGKGCEKKTQRQESSFKFLD